MDANGNIIPIVEGDQEEGFKDEIDPLELLEKQVSKLAQEKLSESLKQELTGEDSYQDQVDKNLVEVKALAKQPPPPQLMTIRKGMTIHFYGYAYKCTAARPNGKVTLKFKGLWKGDKV